MENLEFDSKLKIKVPISTQPTIKNFNNYKTLLAEVSPFDLPSGITISPLAEAFKIEKKQDWTNGKTDAGQGPRPLAFNNVYIFVGYAVSSGVTIIDKHTGELVNTIMLNSSCVQLCIADSWLFASTTTRLYKINISTLEIHSFITYDGGAGCNGPMIYDGSHIWIPLFISTLKMTRFDPSTLNDFSELTIAPNSIEFACFDGEFIWVCDYNNNNIIKINTNANTVDATIAAGGTGPRGICYDGQNGIWINFYSSTELKKIDATTNSITTVAVMPTNGNWGLVADCNGNIWGARIPSLLGSIFKYNILRNEFSQMNVNWLLSYEPSGSGLIFDGSHIYCAHYGNSTGTTIFKIRVY